MTFENYITFLNPKCMTNSTSDLSYVIEVANQSQNSHKDDIYTPLKGCMKPKAPVQI
jgi:hypothetical protein